MGKLIGAVCPVNLLHPGTGPTYELRYVRGDSSVRVDCGWVELGHPLNAVISA